MVKKIDADIFELRVKVVHNQYRAFYCYAVGNLIYILSGFVKKRPRLRRRKYAKPIVS